MTNRGLPRPAVPRIGWGTQGYDRRCARRRNQIEMKPSALEIIGESLDRSSRCSNLWARERKPIQPQPAFTGGEPNLRGPRAGITNGGDGTLAVRHELVRVAEKSYARSSDRHHDPIGAAVGNGEFDRLRRLQVTSCPIEVIVSIDWAGITEGRGRKARRARFASSTEGEDVRSGR